MSFSPIKGSRMVEEQYKRYLATIFQLNDPDYQHQFTDQLRSHTTFAAGPYLEAHDNFESSETTRSLVSQGILPAYFLKYGFHHDRPLYTHQQQAFMQALHGHNIVVSTGTGSGKTESFLMPILAELAEEVESGTIAPGVRALLIYPMNALANDQVERLRTLLADTPEITFGCYTGQTREHTNQAMDEYYRLNKKQPLVNELVSREQMKNTPPHILITNYAMLEYLMVRPGDQELFNANTWRFVVLDEAHVYRGSTGIEVAMLLRRLKATVQVEHLQYFLTSATLGDESENEEVAAFASNLTDETFHTADVIRAKRTPVPKPDRMLHLPSNLYQELAHKIESGCNENDIDVWLSNAHPEYVYSSDHPLFDLIHRDESYWRLRRILQTPTTVQMIASELQLSEEQIGHIVTVASFCEVNGIRLLDARYHTFLRATESVFVTLPPSKRLFLNRTKSFFDAHDGVQYKVFEINTCTSCHAIYLTGEIDKLTNCLEQSSRIDGKSLFYLGSTSSVTDEESVEEAEKNNQNPGMICAICGYFRRTNQIGNRSCEHDIQYQIPVTQVITNSASHRLKRCVCCDATNNYGILRSFFSGQEAVTSVIATSLFEALPAQTSVQTQNEFVDMDDDDFGFGAVTNHDRNIAQQPVQAKQFLCFSDSRQASAYFASYLDLTYRKLLYRRLIVEQLQQIKQPMPLLAFCEDLNSQFENNNILRGSNYRANKESWKAVLSEMSDMASDSSLVGMGLLSFDINQHFPDNAKLHLTGDEVATLLNMMVGTMMNDLAITVPVAMTEEDRNFFAHSTANTRYVELGGDASKAQKSFIPKNAILTNKRMDYLQRVLDKKVPEVYDTARTRKLMDTLWDRIIRPQILAESPDGSGYQINYEAINVTKPTRLYRCSHCHKLTPLFIDGICPSYQCDGVLSPVNVSEEMQNNHYYRLCHDMEMRPLRVKEHTAQLDRDKAFEYQQEFRDKKIDILSCSTTFEMGVDVGSLETVFMRNMPPLPSNYAQRAGRAGRSRNSAAFALTFCNRSNHDFSYFDHPVDMINGKIHAPHFNILNEKIAIRHLYASAMAFFWRNHPNYFKTVGTMAESEVGLTESGFEQLRKYLQQKPEDLKQYLKAFLPHHLYETFGCEQFAWLDNLLGSQGGVLTQAVSEFDYEVEQLEEARQNAFKKRYSTTYYDQRLRTYRQENILTFLSRKNIMPQYGFPIDTVSLSVNSRHGEHHFGVELQRALSMAISEYAPGSQVVANGELFTGRYIKKIPAIGWKMYDYITCDDCGSLNIHIHTDLTDDMHLRECKICGRKFDPRSKKTFLIPSFGFETDPNDVKKPGLMRPEKTYRTDVSYVGYRNDVKMKGVDLQGIHAMIMYSEKDEMAILNRSDFYICESCGYGEPVYGFQRTVQQKHIRSNGYVCNNQILKRYSLGYRFETDVFMLYFPDELIPQENESEAYSVLYALQRGIVSVLNLENSDVAGCLQSIRVGLNRSYGFIFYDTTPGGAGHMRRLQDLDLLHRVIERSNAFMKQCTCGGAEGHASCYACLRNYENQRLHDILDRSLAIHYINRISRNHGISEHISN